MNITAILFTLAFGLALLLLGRSLFWVYVSLLGFLLGFDITQQYLGGDTQWLLVLGGFVVGLASILVAIFFQYWAVGLAGFVGGAWLALGAVQLGMLGEGAFLPVVVALTGGILGAALFVLLFDPALVVLSAITGAGMLLQPFALSEGTGALLFLGLAAAGIVFQFSVLSASQPPTKKRSVNRD